MGEITKVETGAARHLQKVGPAVEGLGAVVDKTMNGIAKVVSEHTPLDMVYVQPTAPAQGKGRIAHITMAAGYTLGAVFGVPFVGDAIVGGVGAAVAMRSPDADVANHARLMAQTGATNAVATAGVWGAAAVPGLLFAPAAPVAAVVGGVVNYAVNFVTYGRGAVKHIKAAFGS